jgi:hypothetical protein
MAARSQAPSLIRALRETKEAAAIAGELFHAFHDLAPYEAEIRAFIAGLTDRTALKQAA